MQPVRRQISFALALVMVISSLLNVVLVECLAGAEHREIELVAHRVDDTRRSPHLHDLDEPTLDAHADGCQDWSLIADGATSRPTDGCLRAGSTSDLAISLPALPPWTVFMADASPPYLLGPPPSPMRRAAIDELAAIRLLI